MAMAFFVGALAMQTPSADSVLKAAQAKAKTEKKNVLVIFHASWCGWCKKMDEFLGKPEFKKLFEDSYVIVHLTVMESAEHKDLENPGGMDVLKAAGGDNQGIPFYFVSDASGKMLANSLAKKSDTDAGSNIGYPAKPDEIEHFIWMLRKTATHMNGVQIEQIKKYLSTQKI